MDDTKHTPLPWELGEMNGTPALWAADSDDVPVVRFPHSWGSTRTPEEAQANAKMVLNALEAYKAGGRRRPPAVVEWAFVTIGFVVFATATLNEAANTPMLLGTYGAFLLTLAPLLWNAHRDMKRRHERETKEMQARHTQRMDALAARDRKDARRHARRTNRIELEHQRRIAAIKESHN